MKKDTTTMWPLKTSPACRRHDHPKTSLEWDVDSYHYLDEGQEIGGRQKDAEEIKATMDEGDIGW